MIPLRSGGVFGIEPLRGKSVLLELTEDVVHPIVVHARNHVEIAVGEGFLEDCGSRNLNTHEGERKIQNEEAIVWFH